MDYMKSWGVFKASNTNAYDLCCFYSISPLGEFPAFPPPCNPATSNMIKDPLGAVQAAKHANLLMVFAGESATAVCVLQALHEKDSMKHLALEVKLGNQEQILSWLKSCWFVPSVSTMAVTT